MTDDETTPLAKVLDLTTRMMQDIRGDLSGLKADITKLQSEMDRRFEQVDHRLDALEKRQAEERDRSRAFDDMFAYAMSGVRVDIMQVGGRLERLELARSKAT